MSRPDRIHFALAASFPNSRGPVPTKGWDADKSENGETDERTGRLMIEDVETRLGVRKVYIYSSMSFTADWHRLVNGNNDIQSVTYYGVAIRSGICRMGEMRA